MVYLLERNGEQDLIPSRLILNVLICFAIAAVFAFVLEAAIRRMVNWTRNISLLNLIWDLAEEDWVPANSQSWTASPSGNPFVAHKAVKTTCAFAAGKHAGMRRPGRAVRLGDLLLFLEFSA